MIKTTTRFSFVFVAALFATSLNAQLPGTRPPSDSTRRTNGNGGNNNGPKAFKDIVTSKAVTDEGLFTIHKVEDKYYFEIPDKLLGRDVLVVNRVSKSSVNTSKGFGGYNGDQINETVIRFEKGPSNRLFLKAVSYAVMSKDSTQPMFQSVMNSNIQPISAVFDIKAWSKDTTGCLIDVSDYLNSDNDIVAFSSTGMGGPTSLIMGKSIFNAGGFQPDKSYVVSVKSFENNIEISAVKTYSKTMGSGIQVGPPTIPGSQSNVTLQINSSFIILPEKPMHKRYYDNRIGYFARGYTDFDKNPQGVENPSMALRWRLEPKEEDIAKYLRGELVEPKKQILYYIDPSTPKKWIPYLIQGVNDWQVAFEKAGFKNAIIAKEAPVNDSNWTLEDARYAGIIYKPSSVANAYGPTVTDPRTGEILESHIGWFHNVMQILRDWYFIQCAATDPKARKMIFDDELMGQLIRFVSSHEVGHTLGLQHNFGSSSTVPVENLRNKAWVEANGHTPSIMDYARFNYVAQPEDNISELGLFPRIGDYDKWAIEWAYRWHPDFKTEEEEKAYLNKWVIEKLKNNRLWWGSGETDDPRNQTEDLGDDAVKASGYGIANLKRILPNLMEWTKQSNEGYENLGELYGELVGQFNRYIGHVGSYVGSMFMTPKTVEQTGPVFEYLPEAKQRDAVDFISKQLFTTPTWLINYDIFNRTGRNPLTTIGGMQDAALGRLLRSSTMMKLINNEAAIGDKAYQVTELLADLKKSIWSELSAAKAIDVYRRNLQKSYIGIIDGILNPPSQSSGSTIIFLGGGGGGSQVDKSDIKSILKAHLITLRQEVKTASARITDNMSKLHLADVSGRIDNILNPKK
jgi:hypothetical protein